MGSLQLLQRQECEPTLVDRLAQVVERWEETLSSFCLIFGFFLGLIFAINPFFHTVAHTAYATWPAAWLCAMGVCFMVLTGYAELYPERNAAYGAIFVEAVFGIVTAFRPLSIIPLGFWLLALLTVALSLWRRWKVERGEGRTWSRR